MTKFTTAVLLSGGLDSAVLLAEETAVGDVQPIYVSAGLAWEAAERIAVTRFLEAAPLPRLRPLASLTVDMRDVYPEQHWALAGNPPGYHTADEKVYLPGRNVILLSKAAVFCAAEGISRLVLGTLGRNPFPDATPAFRGAMAVALSLGLAHTLDIDAPYSNLSKVEVIRRGNRLRLPLELTLSCMNPPPTRREVRHCGRCSKCRERHDAFVGAAIADPTDYHDTQFIRA
ncbi:MAG: 7-cyano-7-deazaguanine synthase [Luteitalea sp.]|nr:7-cyano-7-deazaguanine synthase [Luteitalea sp.]